MGISTPSGGGGAPADAEYVVNSASTKLDNETVVSPASDILTEGSIGTSITLSPGLDTFATVSATAPALLTVTAAAETDGGSFGKLRLAVDQSGGTTPDFSYRFVTASDQLPSGAREINSVTVMLQPGAQFKVENTGDPVNDNFIRDVRAFLFGT
jgi:hypothetical protein